MKIVIAGGSGFIGSALVEKFVARGAEVVVLSRDPARVKRGRGVAWRPGAADTAWHSELADATHVINLAGENIAGSRWTPQRKEELIESRITPTRALVEGLKQAASKPAFISASAIGFYGDRGDEQLTEQSVAGSGFLPDLCRRWEEAARGATCVSRVAIVRIGIVLDAEGGALQKMLMPFRLFAGGRFGSGQQWMSWIDRDDLVSLIEWAADEKRAAGTFNGTAPNPVRNADFASALGTVLNRPSVFPSPGFALRAMLGEMAGPLLLDSARALPVRAGREGFAFQFPTLAESLRHSLLTNS